MEQSIKRTGSPLMIILAFATVYIVWGSTYFFIQRAIVSFPPFLLGAIRFLIAGTLMLGWTMLRGEKVFVKKDILHATVSGVLMLFVGTGAVIWVEQFLPSAMVAIMISSGPLWFILLDKPKWGANFKNRATIGGLSLGFAGILLLFGENIAKAFSTGGNHPELAGVAVLIVGSIAWAAGSLYSKYKSTTGSVSVNIAWQMLAAGVAFVPGSLLRGELQQLQWSSITMGSWLSVLYLVFFGSIAGFSAYVWLLQVRPATQVSTHAYVNPVVAVLLGVFFAGEHISLLQIAGLVTILSSVLIINLVKYRTAHLESKKEDTRLTTAQAISASLKSLPNTLPKTLEDVER
ncbi:MAG: EamA family transporter [Ferruginibacter sp.]